MENSIFGSLIDHPLDPDLAIEKFAKILLAAAGKFGVIAGPNEDDCAVLQWGGDLLVVTTDFLNARPIALELGIGSYWDLGRLVVASSLADLCGSGAEPRAMLIGAMLKHGTSYGSFEALLKGASHEANRWGIPIIGGDTKLGQSLSIFSVALGYARSLSHLFLKKSAQPGDILWVSGPVGSCSAAVIGLSRKDMPSEWESWATERILRPNLPLAKSRQASEAQLGRGGTDISDGIGDDLRRLCEASTVGVILEPDLIPYEPEVRLLADKIAVSPWAFSFGSGGDFQFLLTSDPAARDSLLSLGFSPIGAVTAEALLLVRDPDGQLRALPRGGHRDAHHESFSIEALRLSTEAHYAITK